MSHFAYDTRETGTAISSASNKEVASASNNGPALFPRFFDMEKLRRIQRISASGSMLIEKYKL